MSTTIPALIISPDRAHRDLLAASCSKYGLRPICCETLGAASALLTHQGVGVVFCEDNLPDGRYAQLIHNRYGHNQKLPVIVVSRRDDWDSYLAAMRLGAFDYVVLPPNTGEIERALSSALREQTRAGEPAVKTAA
jgi:phosphoserine phosphatase RsbU/P